MAEPELPAAALEAADSAFRDGWDLPNKVAPDDIRALVAKGIHAFLSHPDARPALLRAALSEEELDALVKGLVDPPRQIGPWRSAHDKLSQALGGEGRG